MNRIVVKTRAKINWTLDIVGKRLDGYHDIETIMQSVDLWDCVIITERSDGIVLKSNIPDLPLDTSNLAWKAADLLRNRFGIRKGLEIYLEKNIPVSAGMAGGSADGAAVLMGLNRLWNLGIHVEGIKEMGKTLGADVPFCVEGGTALAQGIGEVLTPLRPAEGIWLVIIKPSFAVSTKEVYQHFRLDRIGMRPDNTKMLQCINDMDIDGIARNMANVLEAITISMHPEIAKIKARFLEHGALGSLMSGSGPTVFGVYRDRRSAQEGYNALKEKYPQTYLVQTSRMGIEIMEES